MTDISWLNDLNRKNVTLIIFRFARKKNFFGLHGTTVNIDNIWYSDRNCEHQCGDVSLIIWPRLLDTNVVTLFDLNLPEVDRHQCGDVSLITWPRLLGTTVMFWVLGVWVVICFGVILTNQVLSLSGLLTLLLSLPGSLDVTQSPTIIL